MLWRSVFGWGFAVQHTLTSHHTWGAVGESLYNTGVLTPGTNHGTYRYCQDTDHENLGRSRDLLPQTYWSGVYRYAVMRHFYPGEYLAVNIGMAVVSVLLTFLDNHFGDHRNKYLGFGLFYLIFLSTALPFATVVSSKYAGSCDLRVGALLGDGAFWTVLSSTLQRLSSASVAEGLLQATLWGVVNLWMRNTGNMPIRYKLKVYFWGVLVAFLMSLVPCVSASACSSKLSFRWADVAVPLVVFAVVLLFILRHAYYLRAVYSQRDRSPVLWHVDTPEVTKNLALGPWKIERSALPRCFVLFADALFERRGHSRQRRITFAESDPNGHSSGNAGRRSTTAAHDHDVDTASDAVPERQTQIQTQAQAQEQVIQYGSGPGLAQTDRDKDSEICKDETCVVLLSPA